MDEGGDCTFSWYVGFGFMVLLISSPLAAASIKQQCVFAINIPVQDQPPFPSLYL